MATVYWTNGDGGLVQSAIDIMASKAVGHLRSVRPLAGISVGGCISAVGTERKGAFRRRAHTHFTGEHADWICLLSPNPERLVTQAGKPTRLFWHEWAHLVTREWHTERYRRFLAKCGQPAAA